MSRHRKRRGSSTRTDARTTHQTNVHTARRDAVVHRAPATAEVDPGLLLKRAREAKALTLDDLSRTTKINRTILGALESGDVSHLPSGVYARGFVKAYAREVGLDPDEMANQYFGHLEHALPPAGEGIDARATSPMTRHEVVHLDDDTAMILASTQARRVGWLVTACCAIGLVVYVWSFGRPRATETAPVTEAAAPVDVAPAASAGPNEPDAVQAGAATLAMSGPLQIELRPSGLCWVIVTADGEQVLAKLLRDGDQQTFTANDELVLRVGDPGAFTYSINGRSGRSLGRAGEPVNVRITRDNIRDFIAG